MTGYLLDTTPLAGLINNRPSLVALIRPWLLAHEAATSILVYGEVIESLQGRSRYAERRSQLLVLLDEVTPHLITHAIMERYAALRRQLRLPHGPGMIGDIDTLIAATAIEHDLTLVTTDRDFTRVDGLQLMLLDRLALTPLPGISPP